MRYSRILNYLGRSDRTVAGVMSGTSLDGIDVAIVRLRDGRDARSGTGDDTAPGGLDWELLGFSSAEFPTALRRRVFDACAGSPGFREIADLHVRLGHLYADALERAVAATGLPTGVDAVGLHGQTIYHAPSQGPHSVTVQIGSGAVVAQRLDAIVVDDFRSNDVAAGGQGAPLVPYCDYLMLRSDEQSRVALNVGGIANLTWLPRSADLASLVAFDTGPGNMLIDAAMRRLYDREYDADGSVAGSVNPDEDWLRALLDDDFLRQSPPKSSGRERYGHAAASARLDEARRRGLPDAVVVATLTALTARSVADACRVHAAAGAPIDELIVSGGGAQNRTLLGMLAGHLPQTRVCTSDRVGIPPQAKEAVCFAVLANEAICERPANVPSVTGARRPVICGALRMP